jgi:hypothetical protein
LFFWKKTEKGRHKKRGQKTKKSSRIKVIKITNSKQDETRDRRRSREPDRARSSA